MEDDLLGKYSSYTEVKVIPPLNIHIPYGHPYYAGNQITLGHYFRHLYLTVLYVHKQDFLTSEEKRDYLKILRTQMSTYEQALLFYNSLSPMGENWEFSKRNINYSSKNNEQYNQEDLLITNYKLIKNIPKGFAMDIIIPKDFYSRLQFEYEGG